MHNEIFVELLKKSELNKKEFSEKNYNFLFIIDKNYHDLLTFMI